MSQCYVYSSYGTWEEIKFKKDIFYEKRLHKDNKKDLIHKVKKNNTNGALSVYGAITS